MKCIKHKCLNPIEYIAFKLHFWQRKSHLDKTVKYFIAPSKRLRRYLQRHGYYNWNEPIHIPYFVEGVVGKRQKKTIDVLLIGRLHREKGVYLFLDALKHIKKELNVVIVGSGPEYLNMVKTAPSSHHITFTGKVPFEEVKDYYAKSKLVVIPSTYMDNFPFVAIEALSNGVPIIATDRGGLPELVGEGGVALMPDAKLMADNIKILLDDELLRKHIAKLAKSSAKRFDKKKVVDEILKVYKGVQE